MLLGREMPSLFIGRCEVRPYIMGDCAFPLLPNLMKTVTNKQMENNSDLELWNKIAAKTRNPIECAYGILKGRFSLLKTGVALKNEDDAARCIKACLILHNIYINNEDNGYEYLRENQEDADGIEFAEEELRQGVNVRNALIQFLKNN